MERYGQNGGPTMEYQVIMFVARVWALDLTKILRANLMG